LFLDPFFGKLGQISGGFSLFCFTSIIPRFRDSPECGEREFPPAQRGNGNPTNVKEERALAKKQGLLFFFHSDGNLWPIMEDLISIGFDAIHPVDPTSMDIREVKARVGKKLGIMENIHTDLLNRGTPEQVRKLTRETLRDIAPGGGICHRVRKLRSQLGPV
jgi:Uroporphyrinogen decarboxylase (URO-D)